VHEARLAATNTPGVLDETTADLRDAVDGGGAAAERGEALARSGNWKNWTWINW